MCVHGEQCGASLCMDRPKQGEGFSVFYIFQFHLQKYTLGFSCEWLSKGGTQGGKVGLVYFNFNVI